MYILDVFFLQWKCKFYMNLHKKVSTGSTGFFKVHFLYNFFFIKDCEYIGIWIVTFYCRDRIILNNCIYKQLKLYIGYFFFNPLWNPNPKCIYLLFSLPSCPDGLSLLNILAVYLLYSLILTVIPLTQCVLKPICLVHTYSHFPPVFCSVEWKLKSPAVTCPRKELIRSLHVKVKLKTSTRPLISSNPPRSAPPSNAIQNCK